MFTHQTYKFRGDFVNPPNPTDKDFINQLRVMREHECFTIINRGTLWYNELTQTQLIELKNWYKAWLDVTITKIIPEKPTWLNDTLEGEEQIW